jgi:hypothetical protein
MLRRGLLLCVVGGAGLLLGSACYSTGDGTAPPVDRFYYPVGLKVSHGGSVLYAVNSDFDLQYNGGTLQAYDLLSIRRDVLKIIENPKAPDVPVVRRGETNENQCPGNPPVLKEGAGGKQPLGETCAPPIDSRGYVKDSVIVGAFATDLLLSPKPIPMAPGIRVRPTDRLFFPVRGSASLSWAEVVRDDPNAVPPPGATKDTYAPWRIDCGNRSDGRCNGAFDAGRNPDELGNSRHITMPGEPFGIAFSEDATSIVITHQTETKTSLFSTGLKPTILKEDRPENVLADPPSLQFILDGVPVGGVGVAAVPHDPQAFAGQPIPRQAFLQTSRAVPEVTLIRYYPDDGSSLNRAFLDHEAAFPITASAGGQDSRGIAIDTTPRIACKSRVAPSDPTKGRSQADVERDVLACARKPARAFIANRTPAALLIGDLGAIAPDGSYDPDRLVIHTSVPLSAGPSKVYLAPVVERDGTYGLRVFAVCFDSAAIFVYDPEANALENVIRVSPGPFAMAFDPFTLEDVANHKQVEIDRRVTDLPPGAVLRRYRFAYVASFTNSFVQIIDLDNAQARRDTYERVVFSLGEPTLPKGS